MANEKELFKGVKAIGIVDEDSCRLAPVASVLLRDKLIRSKKPEVRCISVSYVGMKRKCNKVSDRALSYLQRKGFSQSDQLYVERISKGWILDKDLILTMDRFIRRDLLYDFPITGHDLEKIVVEITKAAGIDARIRDPGDDYSFEIDPVFDLIDKCLNNIVQKLEKYN